MKEVPSEKISMLRDIILEKADEQRRTLITNAHREAEEWLAKEMEKLQRETNLILQDAKKNERRI